ncbi:16141_t:CDS:1, partial [Cetraspora pellucida]
MSIQEELETYKSPRTNFLYSIFKYNFPHALQTEILNASSENRSELGSASKKKKTLLFAQLLTNDENWQRLKEINKEAERKVEE